MRNADFAQGMSGHCATVFTPNGVYETCERGEINAPTGWGVWYEHAREFRPEWDAGNTDGWCEPESRVNLYRSADGSPSYMLFTMFRIHRGGLFQKVAVGAGNLVRFTIQVQAWSSQDDNAATSEGCGDKAFFAYEGEVPTSDPRHDALINAVFRVGIDPTGVDADPFSERVVWGRAAHVYNRFHEIEVVATAESDTVTLIVEGWQHWRFKHNDMYYDAAALEVSAVESRPLPVGYQVVVELLPQDATLAEKREVLERTHADRRTILQSADDAARLVAPGLPGSRVDVWGASRWNGDIEAYLRAQGVAEVAFFEFAGTPPVTPALSPPPTPDPGWKPRRYVERGLVIGFMGLGNCGLPQLYRDAGVIAPTIKLQQAIWDIGIMPALYRTVRLDDWPSKNLQFSGFDYDLDPIRQAEQRMAGLLPLLEPIRGKVEWVEYMNEQNPPHDQPQKGAQVARFALRCMEIAEDFGWKLANFSFSTGEPVLTAFDAIADTGFLERCAAGGHAIAMHAYLNHRVPGDITHHLCRYRYLYGKYVLPRQLNIPLILTELGPWRHLLGQVDALDFVATVDAELRRDPYAMGQLYCVSDIGTEADYDKFWRSAYPQFITYAASRKDVLNG